MPPLTDDRVIREWVAEEVDKTSSDLTRENVAKFLLSATEEFQWVSAELKSTTHVGDPAIFYRRFSGLPGTQNQLKYEIKLWLARHLVVRFSGLAIMLLLKKSFTHQELDPDHISTLIS